jgi:hypothetical protein
MHLPVAASLACALAAAAALAWGLGADPRSRAPFARSAGATAVLLFFWANAGYAFLWGVMQGNLLAALALFASLACVVRRARAPARRGLLALAAAAAFAATFSHGMGFGAWAGAVGVALAAGLPGRAAALLALAGALAVALYAAGLGDDPNALPAFPLAAARGNPAEIAVFAVAFLGGAAGRVAHALGVVSDARLYAACAVAGAAGLAALAGLAGARLRRDRRDAAALLGLGLGLSAAAGACVVGALRHGMLGPGQAHAERFLGWSVLLWMGIALALPSPRGRRGAALGIACLALLSAGSSRTRPSRSCWASGTTRRRRPCPSSPRSSSTGWRPACGRTSATSSRTRAASSPARGSATTSTW